MAKKDANQAAASDTAPNQQPPENVSLGPACGVVMILGCVVFAIGMAVAAYMLFGKQNEMAVQAIQTQLLPWIEQSELSPSDKDRITERLTELSSQIERGEIDDRQLARIRTRVTQNPVLQWAVVEQAIAFADTNEEFTSAEREQLKLASDRLLQACSQYQVNMEDLGFLLQNVATQESKSMRLVRKPDITHADVISFMQRTEQMLDRRNFKLNEETRYQSVSQVFDRMLDEALDPEEKLPY